MIARLGPKNLRNALIRRQKITKSQWRRGLAVSFEGEMLALGGKRYSRQPPFSARSRSWAALLHCGTTMKLTQTILVVKVTR